MYKSPFYAISKALYKALSDESVGMEWFDSSVPLFEVHEYFKDRSEFCYGIFGDSTADVSASESLKLWNANLGIEIYSNYKGRKVIADKQEAVLNCLSGAGWDVLSESLREDGFILTSVTVGNLTINMPIYSDLGVWQSGSARITLNVTQED